MLAAACAVGVASCFGAPIGGEFWCIEGNFNFLGPFENIFWKSKLFKQIQKRSVFKSELNFIYELRYT